VLLHTTGGKENLFVAEAETIYKQKYYYFIIQEQ